MLHRHPTVPKFPANGVALVSEVAARSFFSACLAQTDPAIETLCVAHLNAEGDFIHLDQIDGSATGAHLPVRTIMLDAAAHGSVGLIVAHNHPSGDATPSASDRQATRRLAIATDAINVTLLDHLVFGGGQCTSFRRMGLL